MIEIARGFLGSGADDQQAGQAAQTLGAGRRHKDDVIDPAVGYIMLKRLGDRAEAGEPVALLHYNDRGLAEQADKLPAALSGGEQQRVAIARALANDPPLVVADEPTGNLDSATADQVFHLFEELVASGKTIVFVTHDRDLARRASRVLEIADGRIVGDHATAPTS